MNLVLPALLGLACVCSSDTEIVRQDQDALRRDVTLSNVARIARGVLFYAMDLDYKVAFTQSTMKAQLKPYLGDDSPWTGTDGRPLDVRINPVLVGKILKKVSDPASFVMLSLGPKAKLIYIDGQTPIAFADGHAKYFKKDAVGRLRWK